MKKFLLHIILPAIFFVCTLTSSAQIIGINTIGSTGYLTTNVGNANTGTSLSNSASFIVADKYTTSVPLTAITIHTWGDGGGNIRVTIYSDNSGSPGTKLFNEIEVAAPSSSFSSITIGNIFLAAGTYWLAFDCSATNGIRHTSSGTMTLGDRKLMSLTYGNTFPNNSGSWGAGALSPDCIYFEGVAIKGYAKATKATLGSNGTFSSVSFYSHAAGNVRLAIYSDNGSIPAPAPSTKQWESGDIAVSASAWTTVNISSGTPTSLSLNTGTYWLVWQWNSAASGPSYVTGGAANSGNSIIQSYGTFPSSWSGGTASTENWSMYATYVACTTPTAFTVTGGGGYCSGGSGVAIGLSNSQTNTNYQLFIGASPVGSPIAGTGSAISFGSNITAAGTYTVVATTASGGCTNNMTNSVTVTVNALPLASVNGSTNVTCFGGSDGTITVLASGGAGSYKYAASTDGVNFNWMPASFTSTTPFTISGLNANQPYRIKVMDSNGCISR